MLFLYLGSIIFIQTYCKPVTKDEYRTKGNVTIDDKGFKRQFDIQCSDTRCCWVHDRGHDTHDHHCGLNLHPIRTHAYQCRDGNGYDGNACGMNMRNCGPCRCKAHLHHGYNDCGRCYCGRHALHNTHNPCNCDYDSHSNHDYIGAGAIHFLDCNSEDDEHPCSHISHAGYAHHRQPIIHHVQHHALSVPHRGGLGTCRVWKENDCVDFLKEFVESPLPDQSRLEPVHLYGIDKAAPPGTVISNRTLDTAPVTAATVPSNPAPQPAANSIYFHQIPIASTHTDVYPLPARVEPTDVEIEPTDTDINPDAVGNTNKQLITAGKIPVTHSNISTVQTLEAPSTASDTDNEPLQGQDVTANVNVPLQVNIDKAEFTNGGTLTSRGDSRNARLTLDSPVQAGGDAMREVQNINPEAESEITHELTAAAPARAEPVVKLAHGIVTDDLQTNGTVDLPEDNAVADENIVAAQTVRKPLYEKVGSTGHGSLITANEDTAIDIVHRPVKAVPSVRGGNVVTNTDARRPIAQSEPVISDVEGSLHEDTDTNDDYIAHARDDQKFVYSNDATPTTGDEYAESSERNPVPLKTHNTKTPVAANDTNEYTVDEVAGDEPTDTDVTPTLTKAEETTRVTNLADHGPVTADQLTTSADRLTKIVKYKAALASRDKTLAGQLAGHLNKRVHHVTTFRFLPEEPAEHQNARKVVLTRKLPQRETAKQLPVH